MTTQRERFETWAKTQDEIELYTLSDGEYGSPFTYDAWLAWQEAERQMIERCAKVCEGEAVEIIDAESDGAYNMATRHCAAAIRTLGNDDAT